DAISFFKASRPDTVGINSYIRLYPETKIMGIILENDDMKSNLISKTAKTPLSPTFYNHIGVEALVEIISGDPIFKIEGFERTSNYERLGK
ncbi:MAG TPA: hypothetical protein PLQ76_07435, partial [bacterium]|nr:hypothetical protein [bacterium]